MFDRLPCSSILLPALTHVAASLLFLGVAGPDWGTLVNHNVAVVLHSNDASAIAGGIGGVGVPDGLVVVIATQRNYHQHEVQLPQHHVLVGVQRKEEH